MVPKNLDEEGDFVLACLRTCEGNYTRLWATIIYSNYKVCGKLYSVVS